jgi:hypothetical protein
VGGTFSDSTTLTLTKLSKTICQDSLSQFCFPSQGRFDGRSRGIRRGHPHDVSLRPTTFRWSSRRAATQEQAAASLEYAGQYPRTNLDAAFAQHLSVLRLCQAQMIARRNGAAGNVCVLRQGSLPTLFQQRYQFL